MQHLHELDAGLEVAFDVIENEPDSPVARELKLMLKDMWWHGTQLSLEILQVARNDNFDAAGEQSKELAFSMFAGPANSKFTAEDTFAHLQHVAARATKGNLRMSKYLGKQGRSPLPANFNIQFLIIIIISKQS